MKKIIAFAGSNSSNSINQQLVEWAAQQVGDAEVEVLNLRDFDAPIYSIDAEQAAGIPANMQRLFDKFTSADAFIVATPEHNGFMPAVMKNTIDWLSRMGRKVFNNKPTVFLSTSPGGRGGKTALGQLLAVMPHQGAQVIGGHSVGSFFDKFENGELKDDADRSAIIALIQQL